MIFFTYIQLGDLYSGHAWHEGLLNLTRVHWISRGFTEFHEGLNISRVGITSWDYQQTKAGYHRKSFGVHVRPSLWAKNPLFEVFFQAVFCRFRRKTSGIADSLGKMVRKQVNTIFGSIEDVGCFFLCRKYFWGVFFPCGKHILAVFFPMWEISLFSVLVQSLGTW